MLKILDIENIAIIEKASVEFSEGLNILTGETGAGKSIIIDSINAVTGEKTHRELIRNGEKSACVSAVFDEVPPEVNEKLSEFGIVPETDGSLLLHRTLTREGKNTCRINGVPVTVSMLKSVGSMLIAIHGQRDSQSLLDPAKHVAYLDTFAGTEKDAELYRESFTRLNKISAEIRSLRMDEAEKARKTDLLSYQINELKEAAVVPGEREELLKRKNILINSVKLSAALSSALQKLSGDGDNSGASSLIAQASGEIVSVSSFARGLEVLTDTLENAQSLVADACTALDDVLSQIGSAEDDMDAIGERLDLLYRLSRKYGSTEEEMLSFLEESEKELEEIRFSDERIEELEKEYAEVYRTACSQAEKLSLKRKIAATSLSAAIENELHFLDMAACRFIVSVRKCDLCSEGTDSVEFLISANAGEEAKPLNKVASGGELSRIMLALKNVLVSDGSIRTLIFDEIDAGVSGSAAGKIAVKLSRVSDHTQVLCITHLSQIAAFADSHKFIYKEQKEGKTYTRINELDLHERAAELARISFGAHVTGTQLSSAEQLIEEADKIKHV